MRKKKDISETPEGTLPMTLQSRYDNMRSAYARLLDSVKRDSQVDLFGELIKKQLNDDANLDKTGWDSLSPERHLSIATHTAKLLSEYISDSQDPRQPQDLDRRLVKIGKLITMMHYYEGGH